MTYSRSRRQHRHPRIAGAFALAGFAANPAVSWACAVCFGEPGSPMVKGAVAGVLVLFGVIVFVLLGVAGTGMYWVHRGRRLARMEETARAESGRKGHLDS